MCRSENLSQSVYLIFSFFSFLELLYPLIFSWVSIFGN